jgi:hypothetical protein
MTPTLQQKPESVDGSLPTEAAIELARHHADLALAALEPYEDFFAARAHGSNVRAWALHSFIQNQRAACADVELDRIERRRWERIEAHPETWDAIDAGRGK